MGVPERRIAIGRFHDGSAKPNWGGRATSLAMAGLVSEHASATIIEPVNGKFITEDFTAPLPQGRLGGRAHAIRRLLGSVRRRGESRRTAIVFGTEDEAAERILNARRKTREQRRLVELIAAADELWMNGEGDFILTRRPTLFRTMVIMAMARMMGKRVKLINSILSESPEELAVPADVREAVGRCLSKCETVAYRDPESLEIHQKLFPDTPAEWCPDALFGWATDRTGFSRRDCAFGPEAEGVPMAGQMFLRECPEYVAVSGSSTHWGVDGRARDAACALVEALRRKGWQTVFVATDGRDDWLGSVAKAVKAPFVPARVPLVAGRFVLAHARAFVSGRYHPSIWASCLGVPTIYMESNSHKTRSLQRVLGRDEPEEHPFFGRGDARKLAASVAAGASAGDAERERIAARARELRVDALRYYAGL